MSLEFQPRTRGGPGSASGRSSCSRSTGGRTSFAVGRSAFYSGRWQGERQSYDTRLSCQHSVTSAPPTYRHNLAIPRHYPDVRWGTCRQIRARGGQVRKGERGTRILSFQDHRRIAVTDERGRPVRDTEGKRVYRYKRLPTPVVQQLHRLQRRAGRRTAWPLPDLAGLHNVNRKLTSSLFKLTTISHAVIVRLWTTAPEKD